MNKILFSALLTAGAISLCLPLHSQHARFESPALTYQETPARINNLIHTRLDVRFDYAKRYLYGKAWISLKPNFYPTDSLTLDAKGMDIKAVAMLNGSQQKPLNYTYDSKSLRIKLDKTYTAAQSYTLFIDYVSKPDELKAGGSKAITSDKGLYFINPDGKDKNKPVQIWTQGETEASSVWFPTIDRPNQKTTSEISMTVSSKYVTLSNGRLVSQKNNTDNTRTDTWKMDQPHSPYLFMMAVGDFKIYKDTWRGKEVSYYLEPQYAPFAKQIFGNTPEMLEFFSKKLGVDYPWNKYAQIVVRDYVSGAMENTTATVHGAFVQNTVSEDPEESPAEDVIAHELFHHWFGDYVTAESWSNLTVNESLADFSEMLWREYKFGKDAGDAHSYAAMQAYLKGPKLHSRNLVRFYYADKEDMFDYVTYQKGGRIVNMLRAYLGEEAFFAGLRQYLRANAFKNAEAHQLRMAFEEVSGRDLNWFFNQWYYGSGHPELDISYVWNEQSRQQQVVIKQTQPDKLFELPIAIDIYAGGKKQRHTLWVKKAEETFSFSVAVKPSLINVDADKVLLANKNDHKSQAEYTFQYFNAPLFADRLEALESSAGRQAQDKDALKVVLAALKDKYYELRISAIASLDMANPQVRAEAVPLLKQLAESDPKASVRATALQMLSLVKDQNLQALYKKALENKSARVQGAGLEGLSMLDPQQGFNLAKKLEPAANLQSSIVNVYGYTLGGKSELPFVEAAFSSASTKNKIDMLPAYIMLLSRINDTGVIKQKLELFTRLSLAYKTQGIHTFTAGLLKQLKESKQTHLKTASSEAKPMLSAQINLITSTLKQLQ